MAEKKEKVATKCSEAIYLQFNDKEVSVDSIRSAIKEDYDSVKKGSETVKDLRIYLKPEDTKAYYVINDNFAGEVELALK